MSDCFEERRKRWLPDIRDGLQAVYDDVDLLACVDDLMRKFHSERSAQLRHRDVQRLLTPDWFQSETQIGYVAYADLFADDLRGVAERTGYLEELGITYLHLMPLLEPRPEPNDGGYAVADYDKVRADLGTMDDLENLATVLHEAGISLTLDLVLNHVAREHRWAVLARHGVAKYRDYFYIFPDRVMPDEYEKTLPEVFPATAPGSFTFDRELSGWVWSTFNNWQWDLNWANPNVFLEFASIVLSLANKGVDCLRLDAIAFIWKSMGTDCQNQPEVHAITQALRGIARVVAPSMIFKAEAIVAPSMVTSYLGSGTRAGKVSDLAYHNSLMVQVWSALASRDARLAAISLSAMPPKPTTTAWTTYLRCHDDIGWAIDDRDAATLGWTGPTHRRFLADFYSGAFPGSFASGADFQSNPATGDRRTSGTAASLTGLETALKKMREEVGDLPTDAAGVTVWPVDVKVAVSRLLCAYAVVIGFGGIPLIYMGDELGLLNDYSFLEDPARGADNRWMHRPRMPWDRASLRDRKGSLEQRVYTGMKGLIEARKRLASLHASVESFVSAGSDPAVLLVYRRHPAGDIAQIYNFSERDAWVAWSEIGVPAFNTIDEISRRPIDVTSDGIIVAPYESLWITGIETRSSKP